MRSNRTFLDQPRRRSSSIRSNIVHEEVIMESYTKIQTYLGKKYHWLIGRLIDSSSAHGVASMEKRTMILIRATTMVMNKWKASSRQKHRYVILGQCLITLFNIPSIYAKDIWSYTEWLFTEDLRLTNSGALITLISNAIMLCCKVMTRSCLFRPSLFTAVNRPSFERSNLKSEIKVDGCADGNIPQPKPSHPIIIAQLIRINDT